MADTIFVVEHNILDMDAWNKFFADQLEQAKDLSIKDILNLPNYEGNTCILTASSGNPDDKRALCFWKMSDPNASIDDFKAFVDRFTAGKQMVQNDCYKMVEGSMGLQNVSGEAWAKDMIALAKSGKTIGSADCGDLYYVHHNINDKAAWDKMFSEKVTSLKGKSTSKDITETWQVGEGVKGCVWVGLGDTDACCLWSMPKGTSVSDFKAMIDKSTGPSATNVPMKISEGNCMGSRVIHSDFYAQEVIAYAESM